jgi:DUF971 family protein
MLLPAAEQNLCACAPWRELLPACLILTQRRKGAEMLSECLPPLSIERRPEEQVLLVSWQDGVEGRLRLVGLRAECMCARCVDEITGERLIDVEGIDADIAIQEMQLVGNYALKIRWSDGHDTGLYTWEHLRRLSEAG